jgi:hypothetical protein
MVHLVSLPPNARTSRRPALQALVPRLHIHRINVSIGKHDAAPAPLSPVPLEADGRQCHPARIRITAMRQWKGQDVVSHQQASASRGLRRGSSPTRPLAPPASEIG